MAAVLSLGLLAGACGNADGDGVAGGDLPLLPGTTSAGGGAGRSSAASEEATLAGDDSAAPAADMQIAPYQPIEYRLASGVPKLGGKAAAYRLEADVDEAAASELAKQLDVAGSPRREGDSWVVGAVVKGEAAPQGRQLFVGPDGSWNMFDARAETAVSSGSASASCAPDGTCTETITTTPPLPPADLLSDDEAEKRARELFESTGADLDETTARVRREERVVLVAFEVTIDDVEVMGYGMSAAFGDKGALQFANGSLATPAKVGDYPLVDTSEAFERANRDDVGRVGVAVDTGTAVAEEPVQVAEPSSGSGSSGSAGSGGATEPVPPTDAKPEPAPEPMPEPGPTPEPMPTLPPKIIELDEARLVLVPEYGMCPGDPVYLVPAYFFGEEDEGFGPVPAVEDTYLASAQRGDPDSSASDDAELEPCPGTLRGETEPGREPDAPPVTG